MRSIAQPHPVEIDPAAAAHEARHAAAALLLGLDVREARADNPSDDAAGHVVLGRHGWNSFPREHAVMILVGNWGEPNWPPQMASKTAPTRDERQVAEHVEALGLGRHGYELLVADAKHLVERPEFESISSTLELFLRQGCVLRESQLKQIHRHAGAEIQLGHKTIKAAARLTSELGEFAALAATWSVDRDRDQIVRGAFRRTIQRWQLSQKRIPVHWNHSPQPKNIIGSVDPGSLRETAEGLFVRGKVDLENSEVARDAWRLMKDNAVSLSFGFLTTDSFEREDGVQELREIDLFEISITPAPANSDTRILSVKSAESTEPAPQLSGPEPELIDGHSYDQMYQLLTGSLPPDLESVMRREEKRQDRALRRKCDRVAVEIALGHDLHQRAA